jgi:Tol biopolymer transport system component
MSQKPHHSRQYLKKLDLANEQISYGNYHLALPILRELWDIDSTSREVSWMTGLCLFNIRRETPEALPYFQKASIRFPEAYYYLGRLYHNESLFDKAMEAYSEYKNTAPDPNFNHPDVDQLMEKSYTAKIFMRSPLAVNLTLLNNNINTGYPDYAPLLTPDGNTMYFTSRRKGSTGDLTDPNNDFFEDIYFTIKENGTWSIPQNIGSPLNTNSHDAAVALSKDGNTLYIYRTSNDMLSGDIYYSELKSNMWTEPVKIDANINTPGGAETSITISPDGNTIYFSSNRSGGFGGKDLYRVTKMPDNTWSRAMNLGPIINTPYDEDGPFIHPDGQSFYFSSKGHENMGGYDIFKSKLNEDGSFTAPVNVGYPINSVRDDIFYFVTHDGKKAYYSSNRSNGKGELDIYQTDIVDDDQKNLIMLKGTVTTNEPEFKALKATITIIDFITKDLQGIYRTNINGKYLIVLLPRKKYKVITEADGYYSHIDDIDLTEKLQIDDLFKSINLKKLVE